MCHNGRVVSRGLHHESTTDGFEVGFCRPAFVKREMESKSMSFSVHHHDPFRMIGRCRSNGSCAM